jgi:hypothetical protein
MVLLRRLLTVVSPRSALRFGAIAHESADHGVSARTPKVDGWWKGNTHTHTW